VKQVLSASQVPVSSVPVRPQAAVRIAGMFCLAEGIFARAIPKKHTQKYISSGSKSLCLPFQWYDLI
jgi:hypothetical protein